MPSRTIQRCGLGVVFQQPASELHGFDLAMAAATARTEFSLGTNAFHGRFSSVRLLPLNRAASAAILPSALFVGELSSQALFFEVMAENVDQRCSMFVLPQCGHCTSPSS